MIYAPETDRAAFIAPVIEENYPFALTVDAIGVARLIVADSDKADDPLKQRIARRIVDRSERFRACMAYIRLFNDLTQPPLFD